MSEDILQLFEGLEPNQVKALRERIIPTLEGLRREITNQKEQQMTDQFQLTEEEIQQILAKRQEQSSQDDEHQEIIQRHAEAAKQEIDAKRTNALLAQYRQEMLNTPRGVNGNSQRAKIKAKYAARGVPVNSVDFS